MEKQKKPVFYVQKLVSTVLMNALNMKQSIAKNVQRLVRNVRLLATIWQHKKSRINQFNSLYEVVVEEIKTYINYVAKLIEIAGVLTIVIGTFMALIKFMFAIQKVQPRSYKQLRQELGKGILLGLEILVAGDIIATVVTEPTMERVLTLGVIILIRTFLSLSIEVEIEGKFPWQNKTQI